MLELFVYAYECLNVIICIRVFEGVICIGVCYFLEVWQVCRMCVGSVVCRC